MNLLIAMFLLSGGVLAALLIPFLRKKKADSEDQESFDIAVYKDQLAEVDRDEERGQISSEEAAMVRLEIQRRLLSAHDHAASQPASTRSSQLLIVGLIALVPLVGAVIYQQLGAPSVPSYPYAEREGIDTEPVMGQGMDDLTGELETRLADNPDDPDGWALLARHYLATERFGESARAFDQLYKMTGDINALTDHAEAAIMANDAVISDDILEMLNAIVRQSPLNPKARFYTGVYAARSGDLSGAIQIWIDLIHLSPADAEWLPIVRQNIHDAAQAANINPGDFSPTEEVAALASQLRIAPPNETSAPGPAAEDIEAASEMSETDQMEMIRSMVQRLADRLQETPDDPEGWARLIQAYEVLGETEKANQARESASAFLP